MTVRLKSGEVVAWSPVDDGPVQQDVPEDGGSISAQLSLSTPGSMVTEAMTMTYDQTEATLSRIRTQLDHAVSGDAVAAITSLADTLPAALPDDPETVGHVADGQTALAGAMAALQRAVDAAQAALKSHELNNGPAHEAAQSAGGAPEREYVADSLAGQIELAFNPAEPRGKGGEWDKVGEDDAKETYLAPISDVEKLADQQKLRDVTGTDVANDLESKIRSNGFDHSRALVIDTYANGSMGLGDGYHRLAAARGAGLKTIPVNVYRNTAAGRLSANKQTMRDEAASTRNLSNPDTHLLTTDLAAWEHEPRGKGGEWEKFTGYLPMADLHPSENTPENENWDRKGAGWQYQQDMVQHIREHGMPGPIEVDYVKFPGERKPKLHVIQGHHRYYAAKQLRMKRVPVTVKSYHGRPPQMTD